MATMTIKDLPTNRALDYRALAAVKGGGGAPWVFGAFRAFLPESARIPQIVNLYQTNIFAEQLNLQQQNINVVNSAANSLINVVAGQGALIFDFAPVLAQP